MRGGFYLLLAGFGIIAGVLACPEPVRAQVAERAAIPDHVYSEAERQIDLFVSWVRNDAQQPDETSVNEIETAI